MNPNEHWENIYKSKTISEMSWTQEVPETSLNFIKSFNIDKKSSIIDIGGGQSKLVDYLIDMGYENITVLDISSEALEKTRKRLGSRADKVRWINADVLNFHPETQYDVWHDRATFHFMTTKEEIKSYIALMGKYVNKYATIGTFSYNGPEKCSGLPIRQYSDDSLIKILSPYFEKIKCIYEDHQTPSHKLQNFLFCSIKKIIH